MEEELTLAELSALRDAVRDKRYEEQKFAAALKGIDLDEQRQEESDLPTFEDVKRRAEAELRGVSQEALEFGEIGFQVIED